MANEFRDTSRNAKDKMRQRMERNMIVAVAVLAGVSKLYAPVQDGHLRDSIEGKPNGLSGTIGTPVDYAPYVEFGTGIHAEGGKGRQGGWFFASEEKTLGKMKPRYYSKKIGKYIYFTMGMKPQPFLRPILDMHKDDFMRLMKK